MISIQITRSISESRQEDILGLVRNQGELSVTELAKHLGVSEVTIRSDLTALQTAGLVRRIRGGVRLPLTLKPEDPIEQTRLENRFAKERIARAAAQTIQEGETVFLDVGSTTTAVAQAVPHHLKNVTFITNGLDIALELGKHPHAKVIVSGGTLRRLQHSLVNPYGAALLSHVYADRLILGCNGVHPTYGVTNANHEEAEIKRLMVERCGELVVVADHTKIGQVSHAQITQLEQVTALITDTDAQISDDIRHQIDDIRLV